jgi:hypothetical protein
MKYIAVFLLFTSLSSWAQSGFSYHSPFYFGAGISFGSFQSKEVSLSSINPMLEIRKELSQPEWSIGGGSSFYVSDSASLIGLQLGSHVGYRLFGHLARENRVQFQDVKILFSEIKEADFSGYADLGFSVTPIFGSNTTATYSGPYLGISFYSFKFNLPLQLSIRYAHQTAGNNEFSVMNSAIMYVSRF